MHTKFSMSFNIDESCKCGRDALGVVNKIGGFSSIVEYYGKRYDYLLVSIPKGHKIVCAGIVGDKVLINYGSTIFKREELKFCERNFVNLDKEIKDALAI